MCHATLNSRSMPMGPWKSSCRRTRAAGNLRRLIQPQCHHCPEQQESKECPEITAPVARTPLCHCARYRVPFCRGMILDFPCRRGSPSPGVLHTRRT